jgi:hypothetical protein
MAVSQTKQSPLDEVMLAMDVVDTLRHRQFLVERELNEPERDKQLIAQLRNIYALQGIDVPDHVLKEGMAALKEERFTYHPPAPGLGVSLARLYVRRDKWLKPLLAALVVAAAATVLYLLLVRVPSQRHLASLPGRLTAEHKAIDGLSQVPEARELAQRLVADGEKALNEGNTANVEKVLEQLNTLRSDLEREYELRIVSRPNERSGVVRTPDVNRDAKNYYVVVEAVASDGTILKMPITSEEDGKTSPVTAWGLRVEKDVYDRVAADKQNDGIIQDRVFGVKRRGFLSPEYRMPTTGAALTSW